MNTNYEFITAAMTAANNGGKHDVAVWRRSAARGIARAADSAYTRATRALASLSDQTARATRAIELRPYSQFTPWDGPDMRDVVAYAEANAALNANVQALEGVFAVDEGVSVSDAAHLLQVQGMLTETVSTFDAEAVEVAAGTIMLAVAMMSQDEALRAIERADAARLAAAAAAEKKGRKGRKAVA